MHPQMSCSETFQDGDEIKRIDLWLSELRSLGISAKRKNDLNDSKELEDLTDNIKQILYQEYKAAYSETA
jgi:hypothetical protein